MSDRSQPRPSDVSRETPPVAPEAPHVPRETELGPTPAEAGALFGDALDAAVAYAHLLADAGVVRGLIGPREVPRIWERHVLNSGLLRRVVPSSVRVADVGSGAGLPGIPLALARPDVTVTLIEPLQRRTVFLEEVVEALGLRDRVEVLRGRAEDLHGRRWFDVVTARAVSPLTRLATSTLPLLEAQGLLLAIKGASAQAEADQARAAIAQLGGGPPAIEVVEDVGHTLTVVRVVQQRRSATMASSNDRASTGRVSQGRATRTGRRRGGR